MEVNMNKYCSLADANCKGIWCIHYRPAVTVGGFIIDEGCKLWK